MVGAPSKARKDHGRHKDSIGIGIGCYEKCDTVEPGAEKEDLFFAEAVAEHSKGQPHRCIGHEIDGTEEHDRAEALKAQIIPNGEVERR